MDLLPFSQSPAPAIGEGTLEAGPPGTARVETMLEAVGIAIFAAPLIGIVAILIRRNRHRRLP
jgi:hypothetical protein